MPGAAQVVTSPPACAVFSPLQSSCAITASDYMSVPCREPLSRSAEARKNRASGATVYTGQCLPASSARPASGHNNNQRGVNSYCLECRLLRARQICLNIVWMLGGGQRPRPPSDRVL